jgi:signal transduction histidine kinase
VGASAPDPKFAGASAPDPKFVGASAPDVPVEDLTLDGRVRLEELVDREALDELCKSFHRLFGIPVRIYSGEGMLLADAGAEHEVCAYVNTTKDGRNACGTTVSAVKARDPGEQLDVVVPCFTGAAYRIIAIDYDARRVGRLIVGPFLPANVADPPQSLYDVDRAIDRERARTLVLKMPRAKADAVTRIAAHLRAALDLILFSGHKALLTSQMHLASVRESYRELQEKNASLQEAYDRLKELDRLKSNFLATVSHELRTPLTSIIGYSEMLSEGLAGELQPEQMEFVRTIHEKGEQLLGLIMSLLDLSKLESGTMNMKKRETRIEPVLGEVVSTLTPAARKKGVELALDAAPGLSDLRGDPERLRQVFINLVENAIKFTPAGGTVTMRARMVNEVGDGGDDEEGGFALLAPVRQQLEVRVVDTGIGIPPRERQRVFDAFFQVDSSSTREYGGTGLGLSIVKRLVEAHGGTIRIEDNEPKGTQFVVSLPPHVPSASTAAPAPP